MCLAKVDNVQMMVFLMLFNPFEGFTLGIDEQRPSFALSGDHTVVNA